MAAPLDEPRLLAAFAALNERLARRGVRATVNLIGGAVLMLVHRARFQTEDADAWIAPDNFIESDIRAVGTQLGIGERWLNEDALAYIPKRTATWRPWRSYSHLDIQHADDRTMLALKAIALRNHKDADDLRLLASRLGLTRAEQILHLVGEIFLGQEDLIKPDRVALIRSMFA